MDIRVAGKQSTAQQFIHTFFETSKSSNNFNGTIENLNGCNKT